MTDKALGYVKAAAWTLLGVTAWLFQYLLWVPLVLLWRVMVWLFKAVGLAAFLLFVPVIGWVILWVILRGRKRDRQHAELVATLRGDEEDSGEGSLWRPWLLGAIKASWQEVTSAT